MELTNVYRDNSIRILRPTDQFFNDKPEVIEKKVKDLCHDTGRVYNSRLAQGPSELLNFTLEQNKPEELEEVDQKKRAKWRRKRRNLVKNYKKTLLNPEFTLLVRNGKTLSIKELKESRKK